MHNDRSAAQYCDVLRSYADVFAPLIAPVSFFAAWRCAALLYYAFCVNALVDLHVFDYSVSTQCSAVRRSTAMHCGVLRSTARSVNAPLELSLFVHLLRLQIVLQSRSQGNDNWRQ